MNDERSIVSSKKQNRVWLVGLAGVAIGIVLCGVTVFAAMPSMMIVTKECTLDFDNTVAALEKRIPEHGWALSGGKAIDMNASLAEHNVAFKPRVKLIKLCKAEYAESVLTTDRHVSCLMPCTMAVWEGDDGKTYLSEMNMGLMAKLFGGNINRIMGGKVAKEEARILDGLVKE